MPPTLLKIPIEDMDLDEFAECLAKARYLEEVEVNLYMRALSELFEEK